MAKFKAGALSDVEKAAIRTFFYEDKTEAEIHKLLNRNPKSKVVKKYISTLPDEDVDIPQEKSSVDDKLDAWKDVIAQTIGDLVKQGVPQENAQELVKQALEKIDLDSAPSVDTLKSFAISNPSKMPLTQIKKWGRSSIVSATEASATASDQTKGSRVFSRKEQGAIFIPDKTKT